MISHKHIGAGKKLVVSGLMLLIGYAMLPLHGNAASGSAMKLVGSWRLVSRVTTGTDGRVLADAGLSATPSGILIYDPSGHVAAQLSRPGRTIAMLTDECQDVQQVKGTPDTAQTLFGYDAYFGTYTVNVKDGIVTHHLDSALFPGDIGKSITRRFMLDGDSLKISFNTTLRDGTPVTRTLIWQRMN